MQLSAAQLFPWFSAKHPDLGLFFKLCVAQNLADFFHFLDIKDQSTLAGAVCQIVATPKVTNYSELPCFTWQVNTFSNSMLALSAIYYTIIYDKVDDSNTQKWY